MNELSAGDRASLSSMASALRAAFPLEGAWVRLELGPDVEARGEVLWSDGPLFAERYGVWLAVRAHEAGKELVGNLFVLRPEELGDPRCEAYVEGLVLALRTLVSQALLSERFLPVHLDQRMPLDVVPVPVAARYRSAFLEAKWLGRFLPENLRTPSEEAYERAPASAVLRDGEIDVSAMFLWVHRHAELGFEDARRDLAQIEALPAVAQTLHYLFVFDGAVNNGGIASFVSQYAVFQIVGAHRALREIGAVRFAELLEKAVSVAAGEYPSFKAREDRYRREKDKSWRASFARDPSLASSSDLDGHEGGRSFELLESEVGPKLREYLRAHRGELVREGKPEPRVVRRKRETKLE